MVGRHAALVREPEVHAGPVLRAAGGPLVRRPRRRAAGERHVAAAPPPGARRPPAPGRPKRGCRRSPQQSPRRSRARRRRSGRAAAPAGCPRRGCRPRRARRPGPSSAARLPFVSRRRASRPPGPRSSEIDMPDDVSDLDPRQAGHGLARVGLERERRRRARRPCARPRTEPFGRHQRARAPAQPRGQPAEEEHARRARVRAVADLDRVDVPELIAPARRVERGGHPLAPRRRPQPGEVDHVGVLGQLLRALRRARGVGLVHGVDQRHLRRGEAARPPPPDARAATRPASGGRSRPADRRSCRAFGRCFSADLEHHALAHERRARRALRRPRPSSATDASIVVRRRLDRAEDRARRRGSGPPARAGS